MNHRPSVPTRRAERGFTLIEVVVTIALMAVLLGLAAPAFSAIVTISSMSVKPRWPGRAGTGGRSISTSPPA